MLHSLYSEEESICYAVFTLYVVFYRIWLKGDSFLLHCFKTLYVVLCWICSIDKSPYACITLFFFLHFEYRILQDMFNSWISIYYFLYLLCLLYFTGLGLFNKKISMYHTLYLLCRMLQDVFNGIIPMYYNPYLRWMMYFTGHF